MATTIDPSRTLGDLVAERPELAPALERLRLDFCCGGSRTLEEECRSRGLDPATVATVLSELDGMERAGTAAPHDLRGATIPELCDHIVEMHHERLRQRDLPEISELLETVVRVHGDDHPELHDLERRFTVLASKIRDHLGTEEESLFPAARAIAAGGTPDPELPEMIEEHVEEHTETGEALVALRELAGDYDRERAYCNTHRRLLDQLEAFELDLHQHVHEENNLLFPRLISA